jgi:hypothetical protein
MGGGRFLRSRTKMAESNSEEHCHQCEAHPQFMVGVPVVTQGILLEPVVP